MPATALKIFLKKMLQALPVLGVEAFLAKSSSTVHGKQKTELLNCNIKGLTATGYLTPNGIVVPKDSQAVLEERASAQKWPSVLVQRNKLIEDGALIEKDGAYAFVRDIQIADGLESARG